MSAIDVHLQWVEVRDEISIRFACAAGPLPRKLVISNAARLVTPPDEIAKAIGFGIFKALRESQRDAAFATYGEEWAQHMPAHRMYSPPTEEEKSVIVEAIKMLEAAGMTIPKGGA